MTTHGLQKKSSWKLKIQIYFERSNNKSTMHHDL